MKEKPKKKKRLVVRKSLRMIYKNKNNKIQRIAINESVKSIKQKLSIKVIPE